MADSCSAVPALAPPVWRSGTDGLLHLGIDAVLKTPVWHPRYHVRVLDVAAVVLVPVLRFSADLAELFIQTAVCRGRALPAHIIRC